ncbi:MAG: NUDIX hydrolase [Deltaproteobacteria bacterium]|nr:NUDIX hydrolase [Deltaproteobacteria bacterium]
MAKDKKLIKAAGGIVERVGKSGVEILLIHRTRYGSEWSLPKGKLDKGEAWEAAALREVKEETGFDCSITGFGDVIFYFVDSVPKVVLFWKMKIKSGEFVPNDEVDKIEWLAPSDAAAKLAHEDEIMLVKKAYSV